MRTARSPSRGRRPTAQRTLLAPAVLATALLATAVVGVIAGRPVTAQSTANQAAIDAKAVIAGKAAAKTTGPAGWRVVATIGPSDQAVTGRVSAGSAEDAWSVWTGTAFTAVERLEGARWSQVPLPKTLTSYARSAVAFGGDSATDFWLFSSRSDTTALRFSDGRWTARADSFLGAAAAVGRGRPERPRGGVRPGQRLGLRPRRRRLRRPLQRPRLGEGAAARRA